MKLVKSSKVVKLPSAKRDVRKTLRDSLVNADKECWDKTLVIGQGRESGSWYTSSMSDLEILGLLERVRSDLLNS